MLNDSACNLVSALFQVEKFMYSQCFEAFGPVTAAEASRLVCVFDGFRYYLTVGKVRVLGSKKRTHSFSTDIFMLLIRVPFHTTRAYSYLLSVVLVGIMLYPL